MAAKEMKSLLILILALVSLKENVLAQSLDGEVEENNAFDSKLDTTVPQLYNLATDPYETKNHYSTDSYASILDDIKSRVSYWSQFYAGLSTETVSRRGFSAAGGYYPWGESDFEPLEIEQRYSYSKAPHIVYVLVDDWGWNDFGGRSTYMSWTTPTINALAAEGVSLSNYYSNELCAPSRGSLLTGRYAFRLGMQAGEEAVDMASLFKLNETEITLAQELKSAGYQTYLIGKWDLGFETFQNCPNDRGFDYFYGYYNSQIDYYTKVYNGWLDLHENEDIVTDETETDESLHSAFLFQSKVEEAIARHSTDFPQTPMFLYYALQLVHDPFEAPERFMARCGSVSGMSDDEGATDLQSHCAMNLMLDEVIANLTCSLQQMSDYGERDMVLVITSDNGCSSKIDGCNAPYRGSKAFFTRGGISSTAIVASNLIDDDLRGTTYDGLVHITDWLPTFMRLATGGEWSSGYIGQDIDGIDQTDQILRAKDSKRTEIVHLIGDASGDQAVILYDTNYKYFTGVLVPETTEPDFVFEADLNPDGVSQSCSAPGITLSSSTDTTEDISAPKDVPHVIVMDPLDGSSIKPSTAFGRTIDVIISVVGLLTFVGMFLTMCIVQRAIRRAREEEAQHKKHGSRGSALESEEDTIASYQNESDPFLPKKVRI